MFKGIDTGDGLSSSNGNDPTVVLLYNFNTGGDEVKVGHMTGMLTNVVPLLDAGGSAVVIGQASRVGPEVFNVHLAQNRATNTRNALVKILNDTALADKVTMGFSLGSANAVAAGDKLHSDNARFRSAVITAWSKTAPPPALNPDGTPMPDVTAMPTVSAGDVFNPLSVGEGFLSLGVSILELAEVAVGVVLAPLFGVLDSVFNVVGVYLSFKRGDELAHFNGSVRGFSDAMQDMASVYSDPKLDPAHPEKWPALRRPQPKFEWNVPDSQLTAGAQEDRAGRREGCDKAFAMVKQFEDVPRDMEFTVGDKKQTVKVTGKVYLWLMFQGFKGDVAGGIIKRFNEQLKAAGKEGYPASH